jgi:hypothetical protein
MNKRQVAIEKEIANIKQALLDLGHMHPGSLSQQKRSARGTYHQLSYSHAGKGHTKYVRPEDVVEVRREIENYRRFRGLTTKWVELEIELATLKRDQRKANKRDRGKEQ